MENKSEGNENKIILGDFNSSMNKTVKDEGKKKQRLNSCDSNYALSKPIVDNGLSRRENPDSSEFTYCNRFSGTRSRIDRVYTDIKTDKNTKINHIMVSFTDHNNAISLDSL